jgi:hypothetical protein
MRLTYANVGEEERNLLPVRCCDLQCRAAMNPIISALAGAAIYGSAPVARAFKSRETRYARDASIWREELAEMLGAQLVNLDSMVHGFTTPGVRRAHGFRAYSTLD